MKRAIIRRLESYVCEVQVPDDWDEQRLMDEICHNGAFDPEIENADYTDCDYDVEIPEEAAQS